MTLAEQLETVIGQGQVCENEPMCGKRKQGAVSTFLLCRQKKRSKIKRG